MIDISYGWVEFFLVISVAIIVFTGYTIIMLISNLLYWFNQRKRSKVTNTNRMGAEKKDD